MLNITELEQRHKKYKLRLHMYNAISIISIFLILLLSIFILLPDNFIYIHHISKKTTIKDKSEKSTNSNTIKPIFRSLQNIDAKKQLVLFPSYKFMDNINTNKRIKDHDNIAIINTVDDTRQVSQINNNEIKIQRQNTDMDIEQVLKRFEDNNNPILSLFIAKKYYELALYDKSYNYALITNNINSEIGDSWIIFTKSLVKLHQKEKAVEILKDYIKHSHSAEAKTLLDEIDSGKFNEY